MPKKAREPRPNKVKLPAKPSKQADQIDALWLAVKSLQEQVDRLESDDDAKILAAKTILERKVR